MKQYKSCSIEYCEEVGRHKVQLVFEDSPGWILQGTSGKEERLFDSVEECYHWALCVLLENNVSVSRKIRISSTSTPCSDNENDSSGEAAGDTVHIQIGGKRKRRGKKKKANGGQE